MDAAAPVRRPPGLVFIWITVALDILAIGVVIPVLPHLIKQFVGGSIETAAWWVGLFGSVFALTQFLASPVQGRSPTASAAGRWCCCRTSGWASISC